MEKIIDMYKACVANDNTPLFPPTEIDDENPQWFDFWTNTYFGDDPDYYQVIDRKFAQMYGDFYYYDFLEEDNQEIGDTMNHFWTDCFAILAKNQKRYQEMYRIYLATDAQIPFDYNYDLTETYGVTHQSTVYGSHTDTIGQVQDTHSVAPFNSTTPQTESVDTTAQRQDTIGSHTDTIDTNAVTNTKKGNIGVQTASDVADRFISMWSRYKFLELIFEDFCKELLMIGD